VKSLRAVLICVVVALAATVTTTEAKADTVQELYMKCKATNPAIGMYCVGYVGGVSDAMVMIAELPVGGGQREAFATCAKTGLSRGAVVQAFVNWAEKHPEHWADQDFMGVTAALSEIWPCGPSK
jgi:hypothetical protein